jgi:hypothetical protein
MSRARLRRIATALAILGAAVFTSGCGSNNNPVPIVPGNPYTGFGGQGGVGPGGCIPIVPGQSIPITFQGIRNSYYSVMGGKLPPIPEFGRYGFQQYGYVANGGVGAPMVQGGMPYAGSSAWGTIQMMLPPYLGSVSGTGYIQVSPAAAMDIQAAVYSGVINLNGNGFYGNQWNPWSVPGMMQPMYAQNTLCVSEVSVDLTKSDTYGRLYGGAVYLYLNGTPHGYALEF